MTAKKPGEGTPYYEPKTVEELDAIEAEAAQPSRRRPMSERNEAEIEPPLDGTGLPGRARRAALARRERAMSTNKAATKLRDFLETHHDRQMLTGRAWSQVLDAALAHERSAGAAPLDVEALTRAFVDTNPSTEAGQYMWDHPQRESEAERLDDILAIEVEARSAGAASIDVDPCLYCGVDDTEAPYEDTKEHRRTDRHGWAIYNS